MFLAYWKGTKLLKFDGNTLERNSMFCTLLLGCVSNYLHQFSILEIILETKQWKVTFPTCLNLTMVIKCFAVLDLYSTFSTHWKHFKLPHIYKFKVLDFNSTVSLSKFNFNTFSLVTCRVSFNRFLQHLHVGKEIKCQI